MENKELRDARLRLAGIQALGSIHSIRSNIKYAKYKIEDLISNKKDQEKIFGFLDHVYDKTEEWVNIFYYSKKGFYGEHLIEALPNKSCGVRYYLEKEKIKCPYLLLPILEDCIENARKNKSRSKKRFDTRVIIKQDLIYILNHGDKPKNPDRIFEEGYSENEYIQAGLEHKSGEMKTTGYGLFFAKVYLNDIGWDIQYLKERKYNTFVIFKKPDEVI